MDDSLSALKRAVDEPCIGLLANQVMGLPGLRADNQVDAAGLVLHGHKRDPLGRPWTLPQDNQACDANELPVLEIGEFGSRSHAMATEFFSVELHRVASQGKPCRCVVCGDLLGRVHRHERFGDRVVDIHTGGFEQRQGGVRFVLA